MPETNDPGMDDEIRVFAAGKPAVPPYGAQARARARERLLAEAAGGRSFRLPRLGWQAAAAFGATVVLVGGVAVALSHQGQGATGPATAVTQSAELSTGELDPRPGQFIVIESDTMYGSLTVGTEGESRHLYRTHRKLWRSVDGSADGLLLVEGREPSPWPGRPLPEAAKDWAGSDWHVLPSCPGRHRLDYAFLSKLPADAAGMRARLYETAGKGSDRDRAAFDHMRDLVRETYLPKAQRDALFEAASTIPGVQVAEGVADSAGRKGVALGRLDPRGTLAQAVFDPATHLLLGERETVVDEKLAKAPKGSVLALTAQLKASVVDELPKAAPASRKAASACPSPVSASPVPSPRSKTPMPSTAPPRRSATAVPMPTPTGDGPSPVPSTAKAPPAGK
ncbi:hypothetical protein FH608_009955 [Nonomuraea phyllanthi]|uniref:Uncharacterized protein n=1 Tax=Nonomuraea phyllanthi TaxID=2219224 RepID=A0A5C4WRJ6_9ACTN|nr:CU044_5270 family protein [Nonomuraea phyllanthi]KAB8195818.1 hypothetical protein FH608_009955 [Nonomuraea phyllanthi]